MYVRTSGENAPRQTGSYHHAKEVRLFASVKVKFDFLTASTSDGSFVDGYSKPPADGT